MMICYADMSRRVAQSQSTLVPNSHFRQPEGQPGDIIYYVREHSSCCCWLSMTMEDFDASKGEPQVGG